MAEPTAFVSMTELGKLIQRGDIRGMSFSFMIRGADGERWIENKNGDPERDLLDLNLYEITITPRPAYPKTSVKASSSDPKTSKDRMRRQLILVRQAMCL